MSINDEPEIRALFACARIKEVTTTYTIGAKAEPKVAAESLICGGTK